MAVSDVLQKMRGSDYGSDKEDDESESPSPARRVLKLSDDEVKSLGESKPGEQVTLQVTGKLEGDHFHVMSVEGAGGGMGMEEAAQVAGIPPTMRQATQISPS